MGIQQMLLNKLKQVNPNGYNFVMQVKQQGRNPIEVLSEMYSKGQINDQQLVQLQQQGRFYGVNIPNSEIQKIKSVKKPRQQTNTSRKFNGWF